MSSLLATAIAAARQGSRIVARRFGTQLSIRIKGNPQNLVTEVDVASERAIVRTIRNAFPSHAVWGEELGRQGTRRDAVWVIDPLDGTTNFTREIPCVSVSVAFVEGGRVRVAAIANPVTGEVFLAERGRGAFIGRRRLSVSPTRRLTDAFVCAEWYSRERRFARRGVGIFLALAHRTQKIRYISGTVWNLTRVARGLFDVETCDTSYLDIVASSLLISEAGGKLTDDHGQLIPAFDEGIHRIVAGNAYLHRQVLTLIRSVR